jgi:hypothetical protein
MKKNPGSYIADNEAWDDKIAPTTLNVLVSDDMEETGLLDVLGNKLYRRRKQVGFLSKD